MRPLSAILLRIRRGKPWNPRSVSSTVRSMRATVDTSAERSERIERVMPPHERERRRGTQEAATVREPRRAVEADEAPLAFAGRHAGAEGLHGAAGDAHGQRTRIVAVEHLDAARREDARLGLGVRGEIGIAIEMVGRDVEHGRRGGRERRRRLELEARQLQHEDVGPQARTRLVFVRDEDVEHRVADVAGHDRGQSGRAAQRAGECSHGRSCRSIP